MNGFEGSVFAHFLYVELSRMSCILTSNLSMQFKSPLISLIEIMYHHLSLKHT